jgi:hypothetical protein
VRTDEQDERNATESRLSVGRRIDEARHQSALVPADVEYDPIANEVG